MAEYNFKNLSDVDIAETVPDDANIIGINNGAVFQAPAASMATKPMIIDPTSDDFKDEDTAYGNRIRDAILKGTPIWIYMTMSSTTAGTAWRYAPVVAFELYRSSQGVCEMILYYHTTNTSGVLEPMYLMVTITI